MKQLYLKYLYIIIIGEMSVSSCEKKETTKWDHTKTYTYVSLDSTDEKKITVTPHSVPDGGIIYFDSVDDSIGYGLEQFQCQVPNYQIMSDFILMSGNFEEFLIPNKIELDYSHIFRFQYGASIRQYYYHNDLQLYKIEHHDDPAEAITDMSMWSPVPFTFVDTTNVGLKGPGKITAQITDVNALYVVARKIN